jgi:hypothetical protein
VGRVAGLDVSFSVSQIFSFPVGLDRVKIWHRPDAPVADVITAATPGAHLGTGQKRAHGATETAVPGRSRGAPVTCIGGIARVTGGAREVR